MPTQLKLSGVITPLVTPLFQDESLDCKGLERIIEHVLVGGVHGIFVLGTTGEGVSCSHSLKVDVIEKTCTIVQKRVPVLVGVTDTSLQQSLDLAKTARDAGADGVVLAPPFYLPINHLQTQRYLESFCSPSPLPVLLYNIPCCTPNAFFDFDLIKACRHLPNVIGIKDSSGDMALMDKLLDEYRNDPTFCVLIGPEELLADAVLAGADGGVSGGSHFLPKLFVEMYQSACNGDKETSTRLQDIAKQIGNTVYGDGPCGIIRGIKAALKCHGIIEPYTLPPVESPTNIYCDKVKAALDAVVKTAATDCPGLAL